MLRPPTPAQLRHIRRRRPAGRYPELARRHSVHRQAERDGGEGCGGEGQALRGQGAGARTTLRMTRSEPCCGVQQVGRLVERQEAVATPGDDVAPGQVGPRGATKLALFAGRRLMLIMGGPRGALVAPLPQCRSEHHLDDEIFEACLSLRGRMRFCTTSQAASLHVEPMFHPEPARRRGGNR
jgi:hypothetical protein